ncbi:hypothetical protein Ssi03_74380 [Sphaerisporangium siamense]|uniref:Uncharacterized protein n=1 Tax=Sphaerisporangium siamense TaxID=795645 RepID=A0A7W7DAB2_9ACTN|nr:hypothetical protein [Sphaerisporangium siamense]MBB4702290.1 hypothetical protein [Sphaerisporangium siamense]GII89448.1 hypothetical protein Ssi03_74380 [Sphaerisporangium siamense]
MQDRTDHILAAIDGALEWDPHEGDAMRWTPEAPHRVQPPKLPVITPEQLEGLTQAFVPLAMAMQESIRQIGEAYASMARTLAQSPEWQAFVEFANSPQGRTLIEAHERGEIEPDPGRCHCFCGRRHDDRMGICAGEAAGTVRYRSASVGTVDVAMCQPCLDAEPAQSR